MDVPVLKNVETGHIIPIIKSRFVIGRGLTCHYVIANEVVSRSHCSLEKTDQGWVLRDSSTNGTMVNGEVYKNVISPILKPGDEICLGHSSYTYKFVVNHSHSQEARLKVNEGSTIPNEILRSPGTPNSFDEQGVSDEMLNQLADDMLQPSETASNKNASSSITEKVEGPAEKNSLGTILDFVLDHQKRLEESTSNSDINLPTTSSGLLSYQAANLQLRQAHLQRELLKKSTELANKQPLQPSVCPDLENKPNTLVVDTNTMPSSLEGAKKFKFDVATMQATLSSESAIPKIQILKMANGKFYSTLQLASPAANCIKESSAQSNVADPSASGAVTMATKETTQAEKVGNEEADKKQSQSPDQNNFEQMEDELMCTICANLFIKAVTLECSHSFCHYCIDTWKEKKSICPICRKQFTTTTPTLVLDNIIEKMLEGAPQEMRDERKKAVEERTKIETEIATAKKAKKTRATPVARRGRRRQNNGSSIHAVQVTLPVIELDSSSDSSMSDTDEDGLDDWGYIGDSGAYYGGYGSCYVCGDKGHWANGCPYR